ncbi:tungsten-containing aldehyde:ferredoxin oxidoreductase [Thermococcus kodakarensis KOD1]|uniref:Tungsten-containing aldehyde ferredoxin oxidoreductase n=1 Tax=Thermococcus kodakarensis (strain ATCC BAA-918 / JCM 12380 / KOD1) TaxID=69014 RepID=AOR_THEKO|nr:aldehyde ferredoxin oxidoreductase [Thermococcus kodakarensis]Q5JE15.1 RecName: Full=Tungsten-containing aldehyde ferredoxin oxidoreductase [Thermococcus kodakarensis KOD1]WCN29024.1 aldehyde ferredoxin oxidoreductase [Thermococcus kodakarensis]WCN31329.1 aldehyde ferredoxin oxidoreductase [Thermococcus kodakarensis]BAD85255.1 tungsten-containing aldehyde:ferredoxin oxidoreductase [Thermococcus kodakarensis KOD1]
MYGNWGRFLRVNLSTGEVKVEEYGEELAKKWLGSRGLAIYLLLKEMDPKADPLGPENKLIITPGPLTGTSAPTGGRYNVVTKSPQTGFITMANSGGYFGAELKFAGWDAIVVEGQSEKPVYIYIKDDHVEIRDASHLWGKVVSETEAAIKKEIGSNKLHIASIGPAGENLVKFAAIMNDGHRAAGRAGVGAVMGSKKLKAIAVEGSKRVPIADKQKFMLVVREKINKLRNDPVAGGGLPKYGTAVLVNIINENGLYPTRNFQTGVFEHAYEQSGEAMTAKYLIRNQPCYACPIGCGRVNKLPTLGVTEGPEYESIWALGANLGINDLASIIEANHQCDEFGLDTISTGGTLAAAMELYEKGYLTDDELGDAPPFRWGNTEVLHYYIEKIAYRKDLGDKLAEGSYRFAEMYGHPEFSMSVKKLELPAYDPRGAEGHGLGYATNNRGGCHIKNYMISPEILGYPYKMDPHDISDEKVKMLILFQDLSALIDAAGLCLFTTFGLGADDYRDMLNAALGWDFSTEDYLKIGERIWNAERLFNLKAGLDPAKDETLPKRFLEEPMPEGPNKGHVVRLKEMLPRYYKLRGWTEDGRIPREKAEELGIAEFL